MASRLLDGPSPADPEPAAGAMDTEAMDAGPTGAAVDGGAAGGSTKDNRSGPRRAQKLRIPLPPPGMQRT